MASRVCGRARTLIRMGGHFVLPFAYENEHHDFSYANGCNATPRATEPFDEGKGFEQVVCDRPITRDLRSATNVLRWLVAHTPEPNRGSKDAIAGGAISDTTLRQLRTCPPWDSLPPSRDITGITGHPSFRLQASSFTRHFL